MSEYKAGDKFIVEIEEGHNGYYKIKELSLCVPTETLDHMSQLVQCVEQYSRTKGQEEAWELIQRIKLHPEYGGIPTADLKKIFGSSYTSDIVLGNTYQEAAAKVEAWEQKKAAPKLTAKERAFCEISGHSYIARDKDGTICSYFCSPQKKKESWQAAGSVCTLDCASFPFITWEDSEPWTLEHLLALEVE